MNTPLRVVLAICALLICVAATQYAVQGLGPGGNSGWLGTEVAGVEGRGYSAGVFGMSTDSGAWAILGSSYGGARAVNAANTTEARLATTGSGVYAVATCSGCQGVWGTTGSNAGSGVLGVADGTGSSRGVHGRSDVGFGVAGWTNHGTAVYGELNSGGGGHAGYFDGRVHVNGTLSKSAGTFKIDHPLDPANRFLSHSFVESPDMKNIYDGVIVLEADGTAVVELPEWFEALNENFRYQLTCVGDHAPVYIAEKIAKNRFRIAGGYAGLEVSWQITGSRKDAYAKAYPVVVEQPKAPHEAGRYLHPELYGQPVTQRIGYVAEVGRVK